MARKRQGSPSPIGSKTSDSEDSKNQCKHCSPVQILGNSISAKVTKTTFINENISAKLCSKCKQEGTKRNPESGVCICLQCGQYLCDDSKLREGSAEKSHVSQHFIAAHSSPHFLGLFLDEWEVRCFKCSKEIPPENNKKLLHAVEFVKKQSDKGKALMTTLATRDTAPVPEETIIDSPSNKKKPNVSFNLSKGARQFGPKMCRVRGLKNLGNTCFFNSVLQCLAQTPFLLDLLNEIKESNEKIVLPEKDDEKAVELVLNEWGPVTEALAYTLEEMTQNSLDYSCSFSPRKLLDALRKKCPQFEGYDQHDSHELLRHLLECVRIEDLRRYQEQILLHQGLSKKTNPQAVDKEKEDAVKKMNQRITDMFTMRPEHLFKGSLVSTLTCHACKHLSDVVESFLDLSLPIATEKKKKNSFNSQESISGRYFSPNLAAFKRGDRRLKRKGYRAKENGQGDSSNQNKQGKNDCTEAEDVEDYKKADGESGYSSEKPGSTRASPVPTPNTMLEIACNVTDNSLNSDYSPESFRSESENGNISLSVHISPIPLEPPAGCGSPDSICANASPGSPVGLDDHDQLSAGIDLNSVNNKLSNLGPISDYKEQSSFNSSVWNDSQSLENDRTLTDDVNINSIDDALNKSSHLRNSSDENAESPGSNLSEEGEDDLSISGQISSGLLSSPHYQFNDDDLSVQSCLAQFTAIEIMSNSNKVSCDNCAKIQNNGKTDKVVYSVASKQFLIRSPPVVLILHLKRFQVHYTSFQKITRFVAFPLILDIDPFCSPACRQESRAPGEKKILYSLYGVVVHSGSLGGGHYIAYVKAKNSQAANDVQLKFIQGLKKASSSVKEDKKEEDSDKDKNDLSSENQWYYISDSNVRAVDESEVLKCEAYLLFYERIL